MWQLAASYPDYLYQLAALLRDPVYQGKGISRGQGQPVLLIPGFMTGDWTLVVMAGWLNRIGYRTYFSGIDWNVDCPNRTGELLHWRLEHIAKETRGPLTVVGHSLGGLLGRYLGTNFPEYVRHVVALGSPIASSLRVHPFVRSTFNMLQPLRRLRGQTPGRCGSAECNCLFAQTAFATLPPSVGFTSIFSRRDEIVDWRSSLDPRGNNQEVSGRHIGLIVNPRVYRILANTLATYSLNNEDQRETKVTN
jgi:pimeloyl-ACP methyl ester carboxylesterase